MAMLIKIDPCKKPYRPFDGRIPAPGRFYGPCPGPCRHAECAAQRARAAENCHRCDRPIGFDAPFIKSASGPVHAGCAKNGGQP